MACPKEFTFSTDAEPHSSRTKLILKDHPEIRELIGRNPLSFLIIVALVASQVGLAFFLRDQSLWLVLITAYVIGAFISHGLFVMIHEGSHDLIFKRRSANLLSVVLADLVNCIPSSIAFRGYHLKHHTFQGIYELDADLPSRWEARLTGNTALGKALWLLLFAVFQGLRPPRLREIKFLSAWWWFNTLSVFAFNFWIFTMWGPMSVLYFLSSLVFAVGLHPLGARWIQEHYMIDPNQETYSYYGPFNLLAFNVGHHNEHHDFQSIPWNRLPKIRAMAPEHYDTLVWHRSWTRLLWRFLFDKDICLFSRTARTNRAGLQVLPE